MPHRKFDDPDLPLQDLMSRWPQTIEVFLRHKMLCVGCMIAPFHAVMDACIEYHLDYDTFIDELRAVIETGV
ncbi:hybrid cluster-associated redox disulfide protein [Litoreibacter halocynthiae]|uniref:Hybrid cluster-associated redox disulfide protein n=1 Tax=Litoreibacter halocynthiae TaxID=1242689 RepID=A0A4R7LS24_9RHOB|nr:DUF1858 domain-containing protein [Litoreibacter halocynthiae]TDT77050.1 hybrid cluster-associated redox disulfide protein [Litoreibacter halocynthiae]